LVWGIVWYSMLRFIHESTKYLLDLASFPIINKLIQKTQLALCKKWHVHKNIIKEGELLSFVRRIGFSFRTFYKNGLLNGFPACYRLLITGIVFYRIGFIDCTMALLIVVLMIIPFFWLLSYTHARAKGWNVTDKTWRMLHEFLHQKNWNALYQDKLEHYMNDQLQKENEEWQSINVTRNIFYLKKELCMTVLIMLVFTSALTSGGFDRKEFIFIQTHFMNVLISFSLFFTSLTSLIEAIIDFRKIFAFLNLKDTYPSIVFGESIVIKNMSFHYDEDAPLFKNFNVSIKSSKKVLIKGSNGSGKSTLIKLLSGELIPQAGFIQRPHRFVVIEQEPVLLTESVRFHLTFAIQQTPNDHDMHDALEKVYLPLPFEKSVSHNLSVGEKVKILIARTLLEKPDVVVLDESLESLPRDQAFTILKLLFQYIPTVIVISHLAKEADFDQVIDL